MSHHRRTIADHVHAERKAPRYEINGEMLNERARLALGCISRTWGREIGRSYVVAGDVAPELGDGQGWTAEVTIRGLKRRGWAEGFQHYRMTDSGFEVLREIDRLYEAEEKCKACGGEVFSDPIAWILHELPEDLCGACRGAGLRRLVPEAGRWGQQLSVPLATALKAG